MSDATVTTEPVAAEAVAESPDTVVPGIPESVKSDVPVLTDAELELLKAVREELAEFKDYITDRAAATLLSIAQRAKVTVDAAAETSMVDVEKRHALFIERLSGTRIQRILDKVDAAVVAPVRPSQQPNVVRRVLPRVAPRNGHPPASVGDVEIKGMHRAMLTALAQHPDGLTKRQILIHTGYASRQPVNYSDRLRAEEWMVRTVDIGYVALQRLSREVLELANGD